MQSGSLLNLDQGLYTYSETFCTYIPLARRWEALRGVATLIVRNLITTENNMNMYMAMFFVYSMQVYI